MPDTAFTIRPVRPEDAVALSEVAIQSKAHWGYDEAFMGLALDELTWSESALSAASVSGGIAIQGSDAAGFYLLDWADVTEPELDAMYVSPGFIGRGLGRRLFDHALDAVRGRGSRSLLIQSDPHAEGFYHAMGARTIGASPSGSIPGRQLPLLRLTL